jgi:hypothetical protein
MLERDGFDVVGDASSTSQLARILTDERPDIVVLDDMIGVDAVEVVTEIVPDARLVVIWPAAVMPIAGAVRVEPSEVATTLTATVALAAGLSGLGATDRPEWIERVKKDPATLREMLAAGGALPARPSVTELQRRGHRLHPSPAAARAARSTDAAAPVVPIGVAAARHEDEEAAAAVATAPPALESRWNRRLGVVSLGSAAAAGAVMIALALGGGRAPSIVSAEPFLPAVVSHGGGPASGTGGETPNPDGNGGTSPNGGGQTGPGSGGGSTPHGNIQGLGGGSGTGSGSTGSGTGGSSSGSGSGTGGAPGGAGTPGGPRSSSSHLPGAHGSGRPGGAPGQDPAPGGSGDHNPHGGPPGHSPGQDHGQGGDNGNGHGSGNPHGNGNGNGNGNGQANGHNSHANAGHGNGNGGRSWSHGKSADAHSHKR